MILLYLLLAEGNCQNNLADIYSHLECYLPKNGNVIHFAVKHTDL